MQIDISICSNKYVVAFLLERYYEKNSYTYYGCGVKLSKVASPLAGLTDMKLINIGYI